MEKKIVLTTGGVDLTFNVTQELFAEMVGSASHGNAFDGAHNFVMQAVSDESKAAVRELMEQNGGAAMYLSAALQNEYAPPLAITVKK